jgi:hypothetical protein
VKKKKKKVSKRPEDAPEEEEGGADFMQPSILDANPSVDDSQL